MNSLLVVKVQVAGTSVTVSTLLRLGFSMLGHRELNNVSGHFKLIPSGLSRLGFPFPKNETM